MFPLNSAYAYSQPQDSCCCSAVESVIVATASGCTCDDTENLAFINVTTKMMKLHSVFGVSLLSIVHAQSPNYGPNSAGESPSSQSNVHAQSPNSESPSSESSSKAEPNSPVAPAPVEVADDDR
ncbi:hypothetical protein TSUD_208760 [Trifolium subterraneum]|uniref:Uncharacterized protein n=1 Tax=Trifolium subterraneum TaxID=3900 RepID=A0A2Z6MM51_TRISU|nr:hypothetical protein TSUD_208760 [Trifolium subterraneum]